MSLTFEEAYDLTNTSLSEDQRKSSALAIMAGTAANDIYWKHADDLTALRAKAEGHGAPPPAPDQHPEADADATAEEIPPENRPAEQPGQSLPAGETEQSAADKLREQLRAAGLNPEV